MPENDYINDDAEQEGRDIREVSAAKLGKLIEWAEADEVEVLPTEASPSPLNANGDGEDRSQNPTPESP